MFRNSSATNSQFAAIVVTGGRAVQFVRRTANGASAVVTSGQTVSLPVYLKLRRSDGVITAVYSTDGQTWSALGAIPSSLNDAISGGLAVCSHTTSQVAVAQTTVPAISHPTEVTYNGLRLYDIGASPLTAAVATNGSSYAIAAVGSLLPGTTRESFGYLARHTSVSCAIATSANPRAGVLVQRAGLMIRESLADNSRHVSLALNAQGRVVFEYRSSTGGFTLTKTLNETAHHLLLDRRGDTISAMVSDDGATWRTVATTKVNFPQDVLIGMMVLSSSTTSAATTDFDGFDVVNH